MTPLKVIATLRSFYGIKLQQASKQSPFRVLVGTILSQRTRGRNARQAERLIFSRWRTPAQVAAAPRKVLERCCRPAGFYRAKASHIQGAARQIVRRFGGSVPSDLPSLMSLSGVGRKTANCVLVYGFNKPAIPVDVHVHRLANRLGWVATTRPEQTEKVLCSLLPRRTWLLINELLVLHGRTLCLPRRPRCMNCPVAPGCKRRNVSMARKRASPGTEKRP